MDGKWRICFLLEVTSTPHFVSDVNTLISQSLLSIILYVGEQPVNMTLLQYAPKRL